MRHTTFDWLNYGDQAMSAQLDKAQQITVPATIMEELDGGFPWRRNLDPMATSLKSIITAAKKKLDVS